MMMQELHNGYEEVEVDDRGRGKKTQFKYRPSVKSRKHLIQNVAFSLESPDDAEQKAMQMKLYMQDSFPTPPKGKGTSPK